MGELSVRVDNDRLQAEERSVDGRGHMLESFGNLVEPSHVDFVTSEEEGEEHAATHDGGISREEGL